MTGPHHTPDEDGTGRTEHPDGEPDAFQLEITPLTPGQSVRPHPQARPRWVRPARAASVVLVVALLLGAVVVLPRLSSPGGPATSTVAQTSISQVTVSSGGDVQVTSDGGKTTYTFGGLPFICPAAVAWSPNSKEFALLGYGSCDTRNTNTLADDQFGEVAVYDAASNSGSPLQRYDLQSVLEQQALPASITANPQDVCCTFDYGALSWTPDGKSVAVDFDGAASPSDTSAGPATRFAGLLLLPASAQGGEVRALLSLLPPLTTPPPPQPTRDPAAPYPARYWSVSTGQLVPQTIQPSLAYRWTGDTLTAPAPLADAPAVSPDAAPGASGNPDGGASFTLWQVGTLEVSDCRDAAGHDSGCISLYLKTPGSVWSPDGTVEAGQLFAYGALAMPFPPRLDDPNIGGPSGFLSSPYPLLPVPDAGLRAVVASLAYPDALVAWTPNGKHLASLSYSSVGHGNDPYANALTVYDCASGKRVASFVTPTVMSFDAGAWSMAWSPDSQRLVVLNHDDHTATLYDASALGG